MSESHSARRACPSPRRGPASGSARASAILLARRFSAGAVGAAARVIECSIPVATIGSARSGAAFVEAVNIAAPIELRDKAGVVEILGRMPSHLAVIINIHHRPDALDRRLRLARELRRLGIDRLLRGRL